eukprot:TRINITY_DN4558_c0_g1_i5.p1 TRINITY_DN4558_c0_g1~~TRINITY_DN4558_c0_g1_i5.p1  ORF type:complete len:1620 (+),score=228.53 TRINITY_DN4558_c0_g1_i5:277-5136(+)
MDAVSESIVLGILKSGKLMKRREFLPKWDERYVEIEVNLNKELKEDQVTLKVYTVSGGTPIKTKTLIGAKIRLADSKKKIDCGRFDIVFQDGDRFRLNAKDKFDKQAWIDEIVGILQDYSEDPLEPDDIVDRSAVSVSSHSSYISNQSILHPGLPVVDGVEIEPPRSSRQTKPGRKALQKIASGVEIDDVQDPNARKRSGRSKSQGKDKLLRKEKSRQRVARTLSSLSGSQKGSQRGSQRGSLSSSRHNSIQVRSETARTEDEEPASPRMNQHGVPSLYNKVRRGPSFLAQRSHQSHSAAASPLPMQSPRLLDALTRMNDRMVARVKKSKSDVPALVRKTISGKMERMHGRTDSGKVEMLQAAKKKPARNKTVARGVSFKQDIPVEKFGLVRNSSFKIPVPTQESSLLNSPKVCMHRQVQDQGIQFSPRQEGDIYNSNFSMDGTSQFSKGGSQGARTNMTAKGKKWKLIKNVMHLMPNKTHVEKIDDYFGEMGADVRTSYEVPPINTTVDELDLLTSMPEQGSAMFASIHEQYVRCREFMENNEALFPDELVAKFTRWADKISLLQSDAPAAAIAAEALYTHEVTRANPHWCSCFGAAPAGYCSPQETIIQLLRKPDIGSLMQLKECISTSSPEWVAMFFKLGGVDALLDAQNSHQDLASNGRVRDAYDAVLQVLLCFQALLSSDKGMELAIENENFVTNLLLLLGWDDTERDAHRFLAIMILTSIMLYDGSGYQKVLRGILHGETHPGLMMSTSSRLDDIAEDSDEEIACSPRNKHSSVMKKVGVTETYIRSLVNMLNTDKGDIDLEVCDSVIKFLSAILVTAETPEERKLRKQIIQTLQKCEVYSVLELLTCDMTFVGNDAILEEIDSLKCHIAAYQNDILEDEEDTDNESGSSELQKEAHLQLARSQSAAVRSLQEKAGIRELKKQTSVPLPPPPPPKLHLPLGGKQGHQNTGKGPKPHMKMKSLFWDKITSNRAKGTVWEKLSNGDTSWVDFRDLENMFHATVKRNNIPPKVSHRQLKVLDIKRATAIGILLNKFPVPWEKIRDTIITLDKNILKSADDVSTLLEMLPKEDEKAKIESYLQSHGSMEGLSEAELVCIDLIQIPRVEERLKTYQKKFLIQEKLGETRTVLDTHSVAMRQLQTSRMFRLILQGVLAIGNFMNYNTRLGNAAGFKLKNLSKLVDTRSIDSKLSLLSYVAHQVCRSGYPILSEEMPSLLRPQLKTALDEVFELLRWASDLVNEMEQEFEHQPVRAYVALNVHIQDYDPDIEMEQQTTQSLDSKYPERCVSEDSPLSRRDDKTESSNLSSMALVPIDEPLLSPKQSESGEESDLEDLTQEDQLRLETLDQATYVKVQVLVDNYQDVMGHELNLIKKRLAKLMEKMQLCKAQYEQMAAYFGDTLQNSNDKEFWASCVNFVERFSTHQRSAYRDLKEEIEKRKRILKRELKSRKDISIGDLERAMAQMLQANGVTDLDAQVEAILIREFGVDRLSLGSNGPEAARRAVLMKIFSSSQQQLHPVNGSQDSFSLELDQQSAAQEDDGNDGNQVERRAHVRRVPKLALEQPTKKAVNRKDSFVGVASFAENAAISSSDTETCSDTGSDNTDLLNLSPKEEITPSL